MIISGQIERVPTKEKDIQEMNFEQTTKRSFTPNTHRTVQITPSSALAVKSPGVSSNDKADGFLGLFATVSNDKKSGKETTTTPLYLGNIDIDDLRRFQQFQELSGNPNDLEKYLQLQNSNTQKKDEGIVSRKQSGQQLRRSENRKMQNLNRRVGNNKDDDSEEKIEALQMLVKSNIQDSFENQNQLYLNQRVPISQTKSKQVSYVMPSGENLNIYKSQVEKPPQPPINNAQLQNSLPFLLQDPSQYKSQSILINPPNAAYVPYQSNTPNPISDRQSTLPFLDIPNSNQQSPIQNFVQSQQYTLPSQSQLQTNNFVFKGNSQSSFNANENLLNLNPASVYSKTYNQPGTKENLAPSQVNGLNGIYQNNSPQSNPLVNANDYAINPYINSQNEKSNFWETRANPVHAPKYSNKIETYQVNLPKENVISLTAPGNDMRRVGTNYNLDNSVLNQQTNLGQNMQSGGQFSIKDLDNQLRKAQEEQKLLQVQLNQLKNSGISPTMNIPKPQDGFAQFQGNKVSNNMGNTKQITTNSAYNKPFNTLDYQATRNSYPRKLSGFPMNFEDMINTGLSLAQQKKDNSYQNHNAQAKQVINPSKNNAQSQMTWNSQPYSQSNSNKQDVSNYPRGLQYGNLQSTYSKKQQQNTKFNPSTLISENKLNGKISRERLPDNFLGKKDISSNIIDTDQIHIIGPNCYIMTPKGFKSIGKAPNCTPTSSSGKSEKKLKLQKSLGNSGSIWDSLTSIPLVNNFAKTIGM